MARAEAKPQQLLLSSADEFWWLPRMAQSNNADETATRREEQQVLRAVVTSITNALGGVLCSAFSRAGRAFQDMPHRSQDVLLRLENAWRNQNVGDVPYLSVHSVSTNSDSGVKTSSSESSSKNAAADRPPIVERHATIVFSKGLGFAGHVFGLYSNSRSSLVSLEEKKTLRDIPILGTFAQSLLDKFSQADKSKTPTFRFYISHDDAKAYLKRLKQRDMEIGSVPLHLAYRFFKERPSLFSFVPAKKQVELARKLIRRAQGRKVAENFEGVPIFTSQNLSILVVSPNGARWFRPYFFKKEELDGVIRTSMEHHYQSLIRTRRARRHNQLNDFPSDMGEEDMDMLDTQDMQEFMEDMDEWGSIVESIMAKAAQMYLQDTLDQAIFGNKWCRMLAGVQPKFPIVVDSFERRVTQSPEFNQPQVPVKADEESPRSKSLLDNLRLKLDSWKQRRESSGSDDEVNFDTPPHLTVVAGIAGSSSDQIIKIASSAVEEAKEKIQKNELALENLFIADLGGPHIWSRPVSGLAPPEETEE